MPQRRLVGLAAAIVSSTVLGAALPGFVAQADPTTLYVNNAQGSNCSDSGSGTQAQPYCTVQAAADAAQPGQTVQIASGTYPEQVTVTHSGNPGSPITFKGGPNYAQATGVIGGAAANAGTTSLPHAFVLSGVHDVTVSGLRLTAPQEAVLVSGSDRITLDGNVLFTSDTSTSPAIRLSGKTTASTISRNYISVGSTGIAVEAGASGAVVTTNQITGATAGITVTDAPGTVVTSNSVTTNYCGNPITLAGNSANSTVENNVVASYGYNCTPAPDLVVSDSSISGTKADYNLVEQVKSQVTYAWGAKTYSSPAALYAATGQGSHDLQSGSYDGVPPGAVDSADSDAPGELATDILGNPRVDDPVVKSTGAGLGYYDRGATEQQDTLTAGVYASPSQAVLRPLDADIQVSTDNSWGQVAGTVDFGDGSPKASVTGSAQLTHTYPASGTYTVSLTVTDGTATLARTSTVVLMPIALLKPAFSHWQTDWSTPTEMFSVGGESPWPVSMFVLDFGDGSPMVENPGPYPPASFAHTYPAPGTYAVTETVVDNHGRSATTTQQVQVGTLLPLNRTIETVQYGRVTEIYNDGATWHDDGLVINGNLIPASALDFTYGPSGARVIEAVENGVLHEIYSDASYNWHDGPIVGAGANTSALSFSYSPSGQRVIEAIEGGVLHEIYSDASNNWHDNPIAGVAPNVSALSFTYNASGQRVIEAVEGGVLHEVYSDASNNWHDNPIAGVAPNVSALSFTYNASGQRVIEAVEGGVLHEVYSDRDGWWHDGVIQGAGGDIKSLSVKVRPTGDRVIEAVENNMLHEIYTNGAAWYDSATPVYQPELSTVSLALR